ncbi:hypothetical protein ACHAWF_018965 [Thalassiosira exigua]
MPAAILLAALLGTVHGLHSDPVPLRGYTCKQSAQELARSSDCSLCPFGFYCSDKDALSRHKCGSVDVYCPVGNVLPTPVSVGYYTTGGDEETRGAQEQCEAGFYCVGGVKRICPKGFFCPDPGMAAPIECGNSTVFCEEGALTPTRVHTGYFSVGGTNTTRHGQEIASKGFWASNGIVKACAEGHYGDEEGLSDDSCSGTCRGGWYCPEASISSMQIACGGEDRFCPPGSARPEQVQVGYYTSTEEEPCRPGTYRAPYPDDDAEVSPISTSRLQGKCLPCPDGTFNHFNGDGPCFKCGPKAKSTPDRATCECYQSATERMMFKLYFHPGQSKCMNMTILPPDDFYPPGSQFTKTEEIPCEKGHFCVDGTRSGRYGDRDMETDVDCSGRCMEGHWCGEGEASTSPTENKCGSGPHPENMFCPKESSTPTYVSAGYYTDESEPADTKSTQLLCEPGFYCENGLRHPCESGYYGQTPGASEKSCDGSCNSGYYCEPGSISPHQFPCGNSSVFCPEGSKLPSTVEDGYYSATENEVLVADYYAGPNATQQVQLECEIGFYCKGGVKYNCPAGTFGVMTGAQDESDCEPCQAGYYCPSHPGPPTKSETQVPCGDAFLFCPEGSSEPLNVEMGHYSITESAESKESMDSSHLRTAQVLCEPGFYCENGIKRPCPRGTYGRSPGLHTDICSELCPPAYFCPENSVYPLPCSPGAYSTGGAKECTSCEIPLTVPVEVVNSLCRNDRSCCLDVFD